MSVAVLARDQRAAVRLLDDVIVAGRAHRAGSCRVLNVAVAAELVAAGRAELLPAGWLRAWRIRCRLVALDRIMASHDRAGRAIDPRAA